MALGNKLETTYLSIVGDKIVKRTDAKDPRGIERINKNGDTVHEIPYDFVEGRLESVAVKDGEYGKQWILQMIDAGKRYTLQLPYSGGFTKSFLMALPNTDLTKSVKLNPYQREKDGKKRNTLYVNQGGKESVRWAYTKDAPNGLPQMEQIMVKGVLTWDGSKQLIFLEQMVKEKFAAQQHASVVDDFCEQEHTDTPEPEHAPDNPGDDLPF